MKNRLVKIGNLNKIAQFISLIVYNCANELIAR